MKNITFTLILFVFALIACETGQNDKSNQPQNIGLTLYEKNCQLCHGKDGKLKAAGAPDLTLSILSPEQTLLAIDKGSPQKGMPAYGPRLKAEELNQLRDYVLGIRIK